MFAFCLKFPGDFIKNHALFAEMNYCGQKQHIWWGKKGEKINILTQMSSRRFDIQGKLVCYRKVNFSKIIHFFVVSFFICMMRQRIFAKCMHSFRNNNTRSTHVFTTLVKIQNVTRTTNGPFLCFYNYQGFQIYFLKACFLNLLCNDYVNIFFQCHPYSLTQGNMLSAQKGG